MLKNSCWSGVVIPWLSVGVCVTALVVFLFRRIPRIEVLASLLCSLLVSAIVVASRSLNDQGPPLALVSAPVVLIGQQWLLLFAASREPSLLGATITRCDFVGLTMSGFLWLLLGVLAPLASMMSHPVGLAGGAALVYILFALWCASIVALVVYIVLSVLSLRKVMRGSSHVHPGLMLLSFVLSMMGLLAAQVTIVNQYLPLSILCASSAIAQAFCIRNARESDVRKLVDS